MLKAISLIGLLCLSWNTSSSNLPDNLSNTKSNTKSGTTPQTMIINTAILNTHNKSLNKTTEFLMTQAFKRLGITIELRYRPDRRSIVEANNGIVDGEFARITSITDTYPNVVIVPEPLAYRDLVVFSLNPDIDLSSYHLGQKDYLIGYMFGWKNASDLLRDHQEKTSTSDHEVLFKLLKQGRIDLALYTRIGGIDNLTENMHNAKYSYSQSLLRYPAYLVLHKKHRAIAPKLAQVFRELKAEYYGRLR